MEILEPSAQRLVDLESLENALIVKRENLAERHFLFLELLKQLNSIRSQNILFSDKLIKYCLLHLEELQNLIPHVQKLIRIRFLPNVPTFGYLSNVYVEREKFEEAINICEMAISLGYTENTKTGYKGRIDRIRKKTLKFRK